jgi:hypothetical protein
MSYREAGVAGAGGAMTQLVRYNAAKKALAEAKAVDEVKQLHDVSAAMRAYAIQAKDKQLEVDASEIRIRAERRLGEMLKQQKETVGLNRGGWTQHHAKSCGAGAEPQDAPPTLADAGISLSAALARCSSSKRRRWG